MLKNLKGTDLIKKIHANTPKTAGVYRMLDENGSVLYVGKAKNLYNRIKNYTDLNGKSSRIQQMIVNTCDLKIITTESENDALLLEQDLIKQLRPKYNIMLTDNKMYPYLCITKEDIPRIFKYRGVKNKQYHFFGPFPSVYAVDESIKMIQKIFRIRSCKNSVMHNRIKPCLLYQIKMCSGICCQKINLSDYKQDVKKALSFLNGNSNEIISDLSDKMLQASKEQDYEEAVVYRDKISYLNKILKKRIISDLTGKIDIIAIAKQNDKYAIEILQTNNGIVVSQYSFFPTINTSIEDVEVFNWFVGEFYIDKIKPAIILTNIEINEICEGIKIESPKKADKKKLVLQVYSNAVLNLHNHLLEKGQTRQYINQIEKLFSLSKPIKRIDVFDNSHIFGTDKVGVMIVSGINGFQKNDYRKYNIKSDIVGDDYAMMYEVLNRRYKRAITEKTLPDLIVVDGGKGQLEIANSIIENLNLNIPIIGIAKGENRNAGEETLYKKDFEPINLAKNDPLLFYFQRIRDESHRFAITTHRKKRANSHFKSVLDDIDGVGSVKKKALLNYFGSVKNIMVASVDEISKVQGINKILATKIYNTFHNN